MENNDWKSQYEWVDYNPSVTIFNSKVHKVWVDWMVEHMVTYDTAMGLHDFITKRSPQTLKTYYNEWLWKWPNRFKDE